MLQQALAETTNMVAQAHLHRGFAHNLLEAGKPGSHDEYEVASALLARVPPTLCGRLFYEAQARVSVLSANSDVGTKEGYRALEEARHWKLGNLEADALDTLALADKGKGDTEHAMARLRQAYPSLRKVATTTPSAVRTRT